MSLGTEWRDQSVAVIGVAVYSRDEQIVKSIAGALKQKTGKDRSNEYVVMHQTSLSSIDGVCKASVFDIDLVDASPEKVRSGVQKIRSKQPNCPIFLVGDKMPLIKVMQDEDIKRCVTRTFAKSMLGPKILTALNLTLNTVVPIESEVVPRSKLGMAIAILLFLSGAGGLAWYLNDKQDSERALSSTVSELSDLNADNNFDSASVEQDTPSSADINTVDSTNDDSSDNESIETVTQANENGSVSRVENDSLDIGANTDGSRSQGLSIIDSKIAAIPEPESEPEPERAVELFSEAAKGVLTKARAALKRGYIVGPENASALYYYRQALAIDPYHELAETRKLSLVTELKAELSLAMEQAKFGRSNSIIKVIADVDPFNSDLNSMRQAFKKRFDKPK